MSELSEIERALVKEISLLTRKNEKLENRLKQAENLLNLLPQLYELPIAVHYRIDRYFRETE